MAIARNTGISHAAGKYVHFMDSDDMLKPDCYESMWALMEKNNFPELAIFHLKNMYNQFSKSLDGIDALETPEEKIKILGYGAPWYKFGRTDFFRKFLFPPGNVGGAEDAVWSWQIVLSAPKVHIYPKKFYYYRRVETGLIRGIDPTFRKQRHMCECYAIIKQWLIKNNFWDAPEYKAAFKKVLAGTRDHLKKRNKDLDVDALIAEFPILVDKEDPTDYLSYML